MYDPHLSHTCPVGILRHCPIHFYNCPLPAAYNAITSEKWFCASALGTISTRPEAITVQIEWSWLANYVNHFGPNRHTREDPVHGTSDILDMAFIMHQSIPSTNIPPGLTPREFFKLVKSLPLGRKFLQNYSPGAKK